MSEGMYTLQPDYTALHGSKCCKAPPMKLSDPPLVYKIPGCTTYFYEKCLMCDKPCHVILLKLWDSFGKEVMPGDVIECLNEPHIIAWKYHAVYIEFGELTIRDLGHNNVGMWDGHGPIKSLGPYWLNLDKLNEEDLEYYWNTTMEEAKLKEKALSDG